MPIPIQVPLPLALHLSASQTYNVMTDERRRPGVTHVAERPLSNCNASSLNDFAFIEQQPGRAQATLLFGAILHDIFNHLDWSQLYRFFTKRFPQGQASNDDIVRTLEPHKEQAAWKKPTMVDFMTDTSSVGLPKDLAILLATAGRTSRSGLMGPDPQPCAIGPAISVACGAGSYMDLAYPGRPPGQYKQLEYINGIKLYGWKENKFDVIAGDISTTKKGGRDRHWAEWAELWSAITDSNALQLGHLSTHSFKYRLIPEEERSFDHFGKIPRQYLKTDAIAASEAIHTTFSPSLLKNRHVSKDSNGTS